MKVFISWSEDRSKVVASALHDWLPTVINAVEPFLSSTIEKGTRGADEITAALESTGFGIICLERANLESRWIHFEAGALARAHERVWTLLIDVTHTDVKPPLSQFQHTLASKSEIRSLIGSINACVVESGGTALTEKQLDRSFERAWPELEQQIEFARGLSVTATEITSVRAERDILEEILETVRSLASRQADSANVVALSTAEQGQIAEQFWEHLRKEGKLPVWATTRDRGRAVTLGTSAALVRSENGDGFRGMIYMFRRPLTEMQRHLVGELLRNAGVEPVAILSEGFAVLDALPDDTLHDIRALPEVPDIVSSRYVRKPVPLRAETLIRAASLMEAGRPPSKAMPASDVQQVRQGDAEPPRDEPLPP